MTLQTRVDKLGHCTQEHLAELASRLGPLSVSRPEVCRWLSDPGSVRARMAQQLFQLLEELEALTQFYNLRLDFADISRVYQMLIGLRDIRKNIDAAEIPSATGSAKWPPPRARVYQDCSERAVAGILATE